MLDNVFTKSTTKQVAVSLLLMCAAAAFGDEAAIRKNLPARIANFPAIDSVRKMPIPGIYELTFGSSVVYTDENGDHIFRGSIVTTTDKRDLTSDRTAELTEAASKIEFASVPLKNAIVTKRGAGTRKLVVFGDPNCGYCKVLEADLHRLDNVTIYTVLLPIIAPDSESKSRDIACSSDPAHAWEQWMLRRTPVAPAPASCSFSATEVRAFASTHNITATPTLVFENGKRTQGAMKLDQLNQNLQLASR